MTGHSEYKNQLSLLKERIEIEKGVVVSRFEGLRETLNKKEKDTLELLDNTYAEAEGVFGECMKDYEKLISVMTQLEEKLSDGSSISDCFVRNNSEIDKRKPKWKSPIVEVRWNIQQLYRLIDDVCRVDVYSSAGETKVSPRRAASASAYISPTDEKSETNPQVQAAASFDNASAEMKRGCTGKDSQEYAIEFALDAVPTHTDIYTPGADMQIVRLEWRKQHPTLNREVQYLDNKDGGFTLEWNGKSFNSSTVELSVGKHYGTLSLGDTELLPCVDEFSVNETVGVQEVLLNTPKPQK